MPPLGDDIAAQGVFQCEQLAERAFAAGDGFVGPGGVGCMRRRVGFFDGGGEVAPELFLAHGGEQEFLHAFLERGEPARRLGVDGREYGAGADPFFGGERGGVVGFARQPFRVRRRRRAGRFPGAGRSCLRRASVLSLPDLDEEDGRPRGVRVRLTQVARGDPVRHDIAVGEFHALECESGIEFEFAFRFCAGLRSFAQDPLLA